jgi:hypothetical protein
MKNISKPVTAKQAPSGYGSRQKSWTTAKDARAQATGKLGEQEPFDCSYGWSKNSMAGHETEQIAHQRAAFGAAHVQKITQHNELLQ